MNIDKLRKFVFGRRHPTTAWRREVVDALNEIELRLVRLENIVGPMRQYITHPVDVLKHLLGDRLPPEKEAELRAICDEIVDRPV